VEGKAKRIILPLASRFSFPVFRGRGGALP